MVFERILIMMECRITRSKLHRLIDLLAFVPTPVELIWYHSDDVVVQLRALTLENLDPTMAAQLREFPWND